MIRNVFRKFYSLKSYRFITKLFSLIVKNASSVLDFILYSVSVAFLFLLFLTF
ncbi:hypothetical protein HPHPP23_0002 [Helicobacter pylori Hp P-23]|uniref:Uncharacterized protein n=1 Tax=Helicobacter pylori Hp P-15 TaxID=992080 RepID=J0QAJ1_HELPX|nr:hypothetical protein HPHPH27_1673 [Helicobacter pylori Hp H-27]EJC06513.1 hypothetical protein HPHPP15_1709 [Helicobacter pylori Hp P-15]EJC13591.1 hypothetical protein HPHPP23_0002 [Helicobacter pylori Hp P-23]EJC16856.1 hypothetical protein HPHPP74_1680 [Helicobacter pylori Hp P-74]EJC30302.1 hypothetical protein HPHPP15B_1711 [Helicobacter pylori Hp P-15b]